MKKWLLLLSASFVLVACGEQMPADTSGSNVENEVSSEVASSEAELVEVTLSVTEDGELITDGEQVVEVEAGAILLDVMKENYEIVEENTFISAINGVEQNADAGKWWVFDVNGAMGEKGAAEIELQAGDLIEWKLEAFE